MEMEIGLEMTADEIVEGEETEGIRKNTGTGRARRERKEAEKEQ